MNAWRCTICQYEYDPAQGDPANGIPPGTSFEELPDGWVCPVCGAGKDLFEEA
ncbi:MAG: rubredoxin [Desulfuromonadales bacterium]|nr:MAG: rubredoxin [Desulfuromonadales bacterium]